MQPLRILNAAFAIAGGAGIVLFAEPGTEKFRIGCVLSCVGLAVGILASAVDSRAPEPDGGGIYARVRHPRHLAMFFLLFGAVVAASSDGKYGHWVPRVAAPLGLLYLFAQALPAADSEQRERLRKLDIVNVEGWLAGVPAMIPSPRRFSHSPAAKVNISRVFCVENLLWFIWIAGIFAGIYLQFDGKTAFRVC
ncbi:MAG: hypothetical protein HY286_17905 [Planctomycetes bacterium]|nr:hypothetical protein [Planctomycetota bacterium]